MGISTNGQKGCPKCRTDTVSAARRFTREEWIQTARAIHGDKYDYSKVVYKNGQNDKITMVCPKHGSFFQLGNGHLQGYGCEKCMMSKGERAIMNFFDSRGEKYTHQMRFDGCRGKRNMLPFDFFLPHRNTLIEFDGEQHFLSGGKIGKYKFTDNDLAAIQHRDSIKNEWSQRNGYKLIRIPYWDIKNIEQILKKELL